MEDNSVSEFGKKTRGFAEGEMSTLALQKAAEWNDALMDAEFKGRGDKEYLARYRLSQRTGVSESYLFRLKYKLEEMKDVGGEVFRRLQEAYGDLCARNEEAADAMRAERMELRKSHEANHELNKMGLGMVAPQAGATKAGKAEK